MSLCTICKFNKPSDDVRDCEFRRLLEIYAESLGIEPAVEECIHFEQHERAGVFILE